MINRKRTGVPGLDAMLHGGFIEESAVLLRGAPGTGKTTLGFHFLMQGIAEGEPGLFISFEEFPRSLYTDAASIGWDLKQIETTGMLHMMFTSPEVFLASLKEPTSPLLELLLSGQVQRIVVDSLTHFTRLTADTYELRDLYGTVINALKREGVTSLLLGEEMYSAGGVVEKGRLSYVVDCIIMLRYIEMESSIERAMLVLKMRSSDHDKAIHRYTIGARGIEVGEPFEGRVGLLSGLGKLKT